jgi:hypothetical protein
MHCGHLASRLSAPLKPLSRSITLTCLYPPFRNLAIMHLFPLVLLVGLARAVPNPAPQGFDFDMIDVGPSAKIFAQIPICLDCHQSNH